MSPRVPFAYESLRSRVTGRRRNRLKKILSEFRREPMLLLNPLKTDQAGALTKAEKAKG
jgi:hypothetical protein